MVTAERPIVFEMSPDEYELLTTVLEFRLDLAEVRRTLAPVPEATPEREERLKQLYERLRHAEWRH